jgi:uncharacterized GH25 family protein
MIALRFLVIFLTASISAQAATLSGTVRDSGGAVIPGAHIIVHWDSSGLPYLKDNVGVKQDLTATTDVNGQFSFEVPAGFYDIFVSATAFSPRCEKVRLKGQQSKRYDFKLKVSEITSRELD